jgi:hypothetical protein
LDRQQVLRPGSRNKDRDLLRIINSIHNDIKKPEETKAPLTIGKELSNIALPKLWHDEVIGFTEKPFDVLLHSVISKEPSLNDDYTTKYKILTFKVKLGKGIALKVTSDGKLVLISANG